MSGELHVPEQPLDRMNGAKSGFTRQPCVPLPLPRTRTQWSCCTKIQSNLRALKNTSHGYLSLQVTIRGNKECRISLITLSISVSVQVKLRDGNEIPVIGFGTYELDGKDAYKAVTWALEAGYRHIDSAEWYENEREVGKAILDFCDASGVPRSDIFYTTKLKYNNGYDAVRKSIENSLDACGLGYIDLYLIHGPVGGPQARLESWRAICDAQKEGMLKSAGISTFGVRHMKELVDSGLPLPVINQIDLHPFMVRKDVVEFCKDYGIALEAWAPLVRGLRFNHPNIVKLAEKYKKEPAQILLRYSLQKGFIPLPKSASKKRIVANTQIFDFSLAEDEISILDGLDEGLITDWDPSDCP